MANNVVIDHDVLGWSDELGEELRREYRGFHQVGKDPELPQRSFDEKVAAYCKENDCDLMTADARSYTHFFEAGIRAVRISRRDWWKKGDRPVYLVQIEGGEK